MHPKQEKIHESFFYYFFRKCIIVILSFFAFKNNFNNEKNLGIFILISLLGSIFALS